MASWDDVRSMALALPETSESAVHGTASWRVEAWLARAPKRLARAYLDALP